MQYTKTYLSDLAAIARRIDINPLRNTRILITGSTGLIGSALCDLILVDNETLDLGVSLFCAGRLPRRVEERFAHWKGKSWATITYDASKDITFDIEADYIFHCASNAHPALYATQPVETIVSNVVGTANILDYARKAHVKRVLYVSSSEVYGQRNSQMPYLETDCYPVDTLNPRACYPTSKRACETLCCSYTQEYGVDSVIARPGHVYGPTATKTDSRAHASFARDAAAGHDIVMKSPGTQLRSYIHGSDCATALLLVMLRGVSSEAYNVGVPDFTCSIRELAEALAAVGGVSIVNDYPTEDESRSYNLMSCSALDCTKLAMLGFDAQYDLANGARSCVEGMSC